MGSSGHIPPASVHQVSPSECLLDLYLLHFRRGLSMMNALLMRLIDHSRVVCVWGLRHFKQTLTVIRAAILVKHVTQGWVRVLHAKLIVILEPQRAFLVRLGPGANAWNALRNFGVIGAWPDSLLVRVFLDRSQTCNQVALVIDQRLGRRSPRLIVVLIRIKIIFRVRLFITSELPRSF